MRALLLWVWMNRDMPQRHGYTGPTEDEVAMLRIGPVVIGWELLED